MRESHWPAVARGEVEAPAAVREWAVSLEAAPKYVVSSTRKDFPWTHSHLLVGDLRAAVQALKDATPEDVLPGEAAADGATSRERLHRCRRVPVLCRAQQRGRDRPFKEWAERVHLLHG